MKRLLPFLLLLCVATASAADAPRPPASAPLQGRIVESMDVDGYTYLRLQTKSGDAWAAIAKAPVKVGTDVTVEGSTVMTNFRSKSLNRTFDRIVFGSLAGASATAAPQPGAAAANPHAAAGAATNPHAQAGTMNPHAGNPHAGARAGGDLAAMHAGVNKGKDADIGDVKVAKASGADARTVAEIVKQKAQLKDKPVLVRGKVVKYTPGVLGRNWIHLRDGTGAEADGTHDVVVTTADAAKRGDVVLVRGTVRVKHDLGGGYFVDLVVEDAKLQK